MTFHFRSFINNFLYNLPLSFMTTSLVFIDIMYQEFYIHFYVFAKCRGNSRIVYFCPYTRKFPRLLIIFLTIIMDCQMKALHFLALFSNMSVAVWIFFQRTFYIEKRIFALKIITFKFYFEKNLLFWSQKLSVIILINPIPQNFVSATWLNTCAPERYPG